MNIHLDFIAFALSGNFVIVHVSFFHVILVLRSQLDATAQRRVSSWLLCTFSGTLLRSDAVGCRCRSQVRQLFPLGVSVSCSEDSFGNAANDSSSKVTSRRTRILLDSKCCRM